MPTRIGACARSRQVRMVDAPAASRVIALTFRQAGKTSAAAVGVAHTMLWRRPASTSLVLAPTLRAKLRIDPPPARPSPYRREQLTVDDVFAIELASDSGRSRCQAPMTHRSAASPSTATAWSMRRRGSPTPSTKRRGQCDSSRRDRSPDTALHRVGEDRILP